MTIAPIDPRTAPMTATGSAGGALTWDGPGLTPCRDDVDLWFAEKPEKLAVAQALCGGCALAEACLEGALRRREPWGVWGGRILVDGEVVAFKRARGRPPRSAATVPPAG